LLKQIEDLHPDCIILDWELPGHPTRKRLPILRTLVPHVKILALSARPESKQNALREGADAFVCKTEPPIMILNKLHEMKERDNEFLTCTFDQV
jgi:DNA-binding response OmpR family regulator